jgi:hypothetical protein
MSTAELVEQVRALPPRERRRLVEIILELDEESAQTLHRPGALSGPMWKRAPSESSETRSCQMSCYLSAKSRRPERNE